MYEPIGHLIAGEMRIEVENGIYKAIKDMGIVIDKEELIKALRYDRGQYDKGYSDGINEFAELTKNAFPSIACVIDYFAKKLMEGGVNN